MPPFSFIVSCRKLVRLFMVLTFFTSTGCSIGFFDLSEEKKPIVTFHIVRTGETLSLIGQKYKVSYQKLAAVNGLQNPNRLFVGQRLLITKDANRTVKKIPEVHPQPVSMSNSFEREYRDGVIAWPVSGRCRIASYFGPRGSGFHDGLDIAAATGTPVKAAHSGEVIYSDNDLSGFGNLLIIRDSNGLTSIYAHNDRLLVDRGESVKRGQIVAEVGATGHASGPHVHFEVRMRDKRERYVAIDPIPLFKTNKPRPRFRVNESLTPILAKLGAWR